MTEFFSNINIEDDNGICYLTAMYKGRMPVRERVLPLDAERFKKGDLTVENLLAKYCSYIMKPQ